MKIFWEDLEGQYEAITRGKNYDEAQERMARESLADDLRRIADDIEDAGQSTLNACRGVREMLAEINCISGCNVPLSVAEGMSFWSDRQRAVLKSVYEVNGVPVDNGDMVFVP